MWAGPCSSECPPAIPLVLSEVPCRVFLLKDPFLLYHMVIIFFSVYMVVLSCGDHRVFLPCPKDGKLLRGPAGLPVPAEGITFLLDPGPSPPDLTCVGLNSWGI